LGFVIARGDATMVRPEIKDVVLSGHGEAQN
jgi:hypothetical protein